MRKYRSSGSSFGLVPGSLKNANFLYLFMGWNVFAFCAYYWYQEKKVKNKDAWKQMSSSQKYMSFMMRPEENMTVVKVKGLHSVDTKATDAATFLTPNSKSVSEEPEANVSS